MSWYGTKKASKLPSMDKSRILVFDVETTGLSAVLDEIIQITILNGYGNVLFSSFIKPTRHKIWTEAQRINGIRYEMVKNSPTFKKVRKEIQELFNNALLVVGYNVNFDIEFVEAAGIVISGTRFDVMTAFASYRAGVEHSFYRESRLTECARYFDYSFNPHDASEDARATLHCFDKLIADERFTTFKLKKKDQLEKEKPVVKKRTGFTIAFKGGKLRSILIGLLLFIIGISFLSIISVIPLTSVNAIKRLFFYVRDNLTSNPIILVCAVLVVIGGLMVIVRIIRMVIMIPKWIVVHIQRLYKRFVD